MQWKLKQVGLDLFSHIHPTHWITLYSSQKNKDTVTHERGYLMPWEQSFGQTIGGNPATSFETADLKRNDVAGAGTHLSQIPGVPCFDWC
jgi:hypothetical protein